MIENRMGGRSRVLDPVYRMGDVVRRREAHVLLSVYEVIKNCPRDWKVALSGPKSIVSSASVFGAQ